MKYLCLGYFAATEMAARPEAEIERVMAECMPHLEALYASGRVVLDAGVSVEAASLRRVDGELQKGDGPLVSTDGRIGGAFILEAADMEEALRLAALHPAVQVPAGEELGWGLEIRPIHHFHAAGPSSPPDRTAGSGA